MKESENGKVQRVKAPHDPELHFTLYPLYFAL